MVFCRLLISVFNVKIHFGQKVMFCFCHFILAAKSAIILVNQCKLPQICVYRFIFFSQSLQIDLFHSVVNLIQFNPKYIPYFMHILMAFHIKCQHNFQEEFYLSSSSASSSPRSRINRKTYKVFHTYFSNFFSLPWLEHGN